MTEPLPGAWAKKVVRGDDRQWTETFETSTDGVTWTPKDLRGFTFLSQIRSTPDADAIMATVDVEFATDGADGVLLCTLTHTESVNLVPGRVSADLQLTSPTGFVQTYLSGTWTVKPDVSRAA